MVAQWKHPNSSHYTCWLSSSMVSPCNRSKCVTKAFIKVKQRLADISVINLITLWVFWWPQRRKAGNMRKDKEQGPTIKLETHCRMRLNPCGMRPNHWAGGSFLKDTVLYMQKFQATVISLYFQGDRFSSIFCFYVLLSDRYPEFLNLCLWTLAAFSLIFHSVLLPDLFLSAQNRQVNKEPSLNYIFRHFVTSSMSKKDITCSNFFSLINKRLPTIMNVWHL